MYKIFALLESVWNLLQHPYNITHLTLGRLLHYLGKLKIQILCRYSAVMEENANKLHFECTSRLPLSGEATANIFWIKEYKVSGRLWEVLKQKLSELHASSTVRICQLLCTAPLETFKTQVFTNNPEHRWLMNTHLLWYLTGSPVGLQLVLLTQESRLNH